MTDRTDAMISAFAEAVAEHGPPVVTLAPVAGAPFPRDGITRSNETVARDRRGPIGVVRSFDPGEMANRVTTVTPGPGTAPGTTGTVVCHLPSGTC